MAAHFWKMTKGKCPNNLTVWNVLSPQSLHRQRLGRTQDRRAAWRPWSSPGGSGSCPNPAGNDRSEKNYVLIDYERLFFPIANLKSLLRKSKLIDGLQKMVHSCFGFETCSKWFPDVVVSLILWMPMNSVNPINEGTALRIEFGLFVDFHCEVFFDLNQQKKSPKLPFR